MRSASSLRRVEEVLARLRVVLGAALENLDRARDPGQWVAQLMGGVGDEVGFGELAAHLLGAVADDGEDGALVRAGSGPASSRRGRRCEAPDGRRSRPRRRGADGEAAPRRACPAGSRSLAAALLEKRTEPPSSTTITASVRPSKIAASLLRSAVRTPKLSLSEARIDSRARARSPISSGPETSREASKEPAAISPAAWARRATRWEIATAIRKPASTPSATAATRARWLAPKR